MPKSQTSARLRIRFYPIPVIIIFISVNVTTPVDNTRLFWSSESTRYRRCQRWLHAGCRMPEVRHPPKLSGHSKITAQQSSSAVSAAPSHDCPWKSLLHQNGGALILRLPCQPPSPTVSISLHPGQASSHGGSAPRTAISPPPPPHVHCLRRSLHLLRSGTHPLSLPRPPAILAQFSLYTCHQFASRVVGR